MTKAEQAALAEMDTTPERIAERQEHISQLLNGEQMIEVNGTRLSLTDYNAYLKENAVVPKTLGEQLKASVAIESKKLDNLIPSAWGGLAGGTKPPRKKRSDAGKPKQKAPAIAQQPGFLSSMQVLRLRDLIDTRETRRIELETAKDHLANREGALDAADNELDDFLNELQGKGK